jgi:hypothetical protein
MSEAAVFVKTEDDQVLEMTQGVANMCMTLKNMLEGTLTVFINFDSLKSRDFTLVGVYRFQRARNHQGRTHPFEQHQGSTHEVYRQLVCHSPSETTQMPDYWQLVQDGAVFCRMMTWKIRASRNIKPRLICFLRMNRCSKS